MLDRIKREDERIAALIAPLESYERLKQYVHYEMAQYHSKAMASGRAVYQGPVARLCGESLIFYIHDKLTMVQFNNQSFNEAYGWWIVDERDLDQIEKHER